MSRDIEEIRRKIYAQQGNDFVFPAIVRKVDEAEFTCQVERDGPVDYFDVRLRALANPDLKGFAFIPKVGSMVLVCRIGESNELFVCQYTEIDKVFLTTGDVSLTVDKETIQLSKADKVAATIDAGSLTLRVEQATVRVTTNGVTLSRGNSGLKKTLDDLITAIRELTVTTGVGPSGPPINMADFVKIQQDLNNYLEE